jgi:transcriptional regulator with XRE-family HTH domain
MPQDLNVIGKALAYLRNSRNMSQSDLVAAVTRFGCYMTRDIVGSIENGRCVASDKYIEMFAAALQVKEQDFFPPKRHWIDHPPEFRETPHRHRKKKPRLARRGKK